MRNNYMEGSGFAFCKCENKGADKLLSFRYIDSTVRLLPKSKISSPLPSSIAKQPSLYQTWSEIPKTGFIMTQLILRLSNQSLRLSSTFGSMSTLVANQKYLHIMVTKCLLLQIQ